MNATSLAKAARESLKCLTFIPNANMEDSWIWPSNMNGGYTSKACYKWFLTANPTDIFASTDYYILTRIWKLCCREKIRFLV